MVMDAACSKIAWPWRAVVKGLAQNRVTFSTAKFAGGEGFAEEVFRQITEEDNIGWFFGGLQMPWKSIKDVRLIIDPKSKKCRGFCYIFFHDEASLRQALQLNGQKPPRDGELYRFVSMWKRGEESICIEEATSKKESDMGALRKVDWGVFKMIEHAAPTFGAHFGDATSEAVRKVIEDFGIAAPLPTSHNTCPSLAARESYKVEALLDVAIQDDSLKQDEYQVIVKNTFLDMEQPHVDKAPRYSTEPPTRAACEVDPDEFDDDVDAQAEPPLQPCTTAHPVSPDVSTSDTMTPTTFLLSDVACQLKVKNTFLDTSTKHPNADKAPRYSTEPPTRAACEIDPDDFDYDVDAQTGPPSHACTTVPLVPPTTPTSLLLSGRLCQVKVKNTFIDIQTEEPEPLSRIKSTS